MSTFLRCHSPLYRWCELPKKKLNLLELLKAIDPHFGSGYFCA